MKYESFGTVSAEPGARQSQADRIRGMIWKQIVTVQLRPGQVLVESDLAAEFGVSKTPVREALQTLSALGLVRVLPHKGYVVRSLELSDVREVMDLRMLLEPPLVGLAAKRVSDELVAQLRALLVKQFDPAATLDDQLDAAHGFHIALLRGSGNRRAAAIIETLSYEVLRLHHLMPPVRDHISSPAESDSHHAILEAVAAGDPVEASAQMRAHLAESDEAMVRAFYDRASISDFA